MLNQLKPGDTIVLFQALDLYEIESGCLGPKQKIVPRGGFIAVTEQRLVVKASQLTTTTVGNNNVNWNAKTQTINVPVSKVSSVTVEREEKMGGGCLSTKSSAYVLVLNVQGGIYRIYTGENSTIADEFVRSYLDFEDRHQ